MTGAGMAGLTYFANNEDDPYITLKDPVSNTIYIYSQKHASYNKSVDILQQTCYQRPNIRMCLHGLQQLVDDKSIASCQHTCCKLLKFPWFPDHVWIDYAGIDKFGPSCNKLIKCTLIKFE